MISLEPQKGPDMEGGIDLLWLWVSQVKEHGEMEAMKRMDLCLGLGPR